MNNPILFVDWMGMGPSGPQDDILDQLEIEQGYQVSTDNNTGETTIIQTSASFDPDVDLSEGLAKITVSTTTTIMGSDGNVASVAVSNTNLDVSLDISTNSKDGGASYSVTGSKTSKGESMNSARNPELITDYAANDPIVAGVSNVLSSSPGRNALTMQDSRLPGLSTMDRAENAAPSIIEGLGIVGKFQTLNVGNAVNKDAFGATQLRIPMSRVDKSARRLQQLSKKIYPILN